jgi:hypothetical protein
MTIVIELSGEKQQKFGKPKCCICEKQHPSNRVPSELVMPEKTYVTTEATAAPSANLATLAPKDVLGKIPEPVPSKNITEAEVFILVTTVQQIMVALKAAERR